MIIPVLSIFLIIILVIIILLSWKYSFDLEYKLKEGDLELLTSAAYKITEVIRAPLGSRIENMFINNNYENQQMVPVRLPDGRIGLIPLNSIIQHQNNLI